MFQRRAIPRPDALETVIPDGSDREAVDDAAAFPWRMVCALTIEAPNGLTAHGTGWLAGPRTVITAGHCLFHPTDLGGLATSVTVAPGLRPDGATFGPFEGANFRVLPQWLNAMNVEFDVGALTLNTDVGTDAGFFASAVRSASDLEPLFAHVSGYPLDLGGGTRQFHHRHRVRTARGRRLFYTVDTNQGQRGAPVWIVDSDAGPPLVVGIHTYGDDQTPPDLKPSNSATLVTPEVQAQIAAWVAEDLT